MRILSDEGLQYSVEVFPFDTYGDVRKRMNDKFFSEKRKSVAAFKIQGNSDDDHNSILDENAKVSLFQRHPLVAIISKPTKENISIAVDCITGLHFTPAFSTMLRHHGLIVRGNIIESLETRNSVSLVQETGCNDEEDESDDVPCFKWSENNVLNFNVSSDYHTAYLSLNVTCGNVPVAKVDITLPPFNIASSKKWYPLDIPSGASIKLCVGNPGVNNSSIITVAQEVGSTKIICSPRNSRMSILESNHPTGRNATMRIKTKTIGAEEDRNLEAWRFNESDSSKDCDSRSSHCSSEEFSSAKEDETEESVSETKKLWDMAVDQKVEDSATTRDNEDTTAAAAAPSVSESIETLSEDGGNSGYNNNTIQNPLEEETKDVDETSTELLKQNIKEDEEEVTCDTIQDIEETSTELLQQDTEQDEDNASDTIQQEGVIPDQAEKELTEEAISTEPIEDSSTDQVEKEKSIVHTEGSGTEQVLKANGTDEKTSDNTEDTSTDQKEDEQIKEENGGTESVDVISTERIEEDSSEKLAETEPKNPDPVEKRESEQSSTMENVEDENDTKTNSTLVEQKDTETSKEMFEEEKQQCNVTRKDEASDVVAGTTNTTNSDGIMLVSTDEAEKLKTDRSAKLLNPASSPTRSSDVSLEDGWNPCSSSTTTSTIIADPTSTTTNNSISANRRPSLEFELVADTLVDTSIQSRPRRHRTGSSRSGSVCSVGSSSSSRGEEYDSNMKERDNGDHKTKSSNNQRNNNNDVIPALVRIGTVVRLGPFRAVVKFVGLTTFAHGVWIGIEFDEPVGRNSGDVHGNTYFECKSMHGIFVRADSKALHVVSTTTISEKQEKITYHNRGIIKN